MPDPAKSAELLKEIRQVNPEFQAGDTRKKEVVVYLEKDVRDLIQSAMQQVKQQKFSEALALLEKSIKIKETAFALQLMGNIYIQLSDNRALAVLERAHVIDPKDLKTINNLFVIYLRSGNYEMASQMLEEYKPLSPDQERIKNLSNLLKKEMSKK